MPSRGTAGDASASQGLPDEDTVPIPWLDERRARVQDKAAKRFGDWTPRSEFEVVRLPLPKDVQFFKENGKLWLQSALGRSEFTTKHVGPRLNFSHGVAPGGTPYTGWAVRPGVNDDGGRFVDFAPTHYADHPKVKGAKTDYTGDLARRWTRAIEDVTRGVLYELEVVGVGFRVALNTSKDPETDTTVQTLDFKLGQSHPLLVRIPPGMRCVLPSPTKIMLFGLDRQQVGTVSAQIARLRRPTKYENKGVYVRRHGASA